MLFSHVGRSELLIFSLGLENSLDGLFLFIREKVKVTSDHRSGLVANPIVDDTLLNTCCGTVAAK